MDDREYFFIGYTGNRNLSEKDFSKYSMQELKNMMKSQAKRLNTRLSTLESKGMTSSYAYQKAVQMAYDATHTHKAHYEFMREQEKPRFETAVNVYENVDGGQMKVRERTRAEIIEQLIEMGKWESYKSSTVSGMMEAFQKRFENMQEHGYKGTFNEYADLVTNDAYDTISRYYGSDTAAYIVSTYSEEAVDAFISKHPEFFTNNNPLDGQGGMLESEFSAWYEANWEDTSSVSDEESVTDIMSTDY